MSGNTQKLISDCCHASATAERLISTEAQFRCSCCGEPCKAIANDGIEGLTHREASIIYREEVDSEAREWSCNNFAFEVDVLNFAKNHKVEFSSDPKKAWGNLRVDITLSDGGEVGTAFDGSVPMAVCAALIRATRLRNRLPTNEELLALNIIKIREQFIKEVMGGSCDKEHSNLHVIHDALSFTLEARPTAMAYLQGSAGLCFLINDKEFKTGTSEFSRAVLIAAIFVKREEKK
jgi:hypothetical protein